MDIFFVVFTAIIIIFILSLPVLVVSPKTAALSGYLTTTTPGVSLEGIQVFAGDGSSQWLAVSDSTGNFSFVALPYGTYEIDAVKELPDTPTSTQVLLAAKRGVTVSGDTNIGELPLERGTWI